MGMAVRLLGSLEVTVDGVDVTPTAPKERALFALLAIHRGHIVSSERLAEELWPDVEPARARRGLQVRMASLRQVLARSQADARIEFVAPGYRLVLPPGTVDVDRCFELLSAGRALAGAGDAESARTTFRRAIDMFQDEPLVGLDSTPSLVAEAGRLHDARLSAVEDWIDAELACGHHHSVVGELDRLVAENALRERLWAQWILALYRCGRQADALRAFSSVRHRLVDELGVEPSAELCDLELAVLQHRPELDGKAEPGAHRGEGPEPSTQEDFRPLPPVRFARARGGVNIGYRVLGDGPDLLIVPGFISHLDMWWESRAIGLVERLSSTNRLILFDKRGMGLSDRPANIAIEDWLDDIHAVLDAVGSESAAIVGVSAGGGIGILFASIYPDRVDSLVVYGGWSRALWAPDYPIGLMPMPDAPARLASKWGTASTFDASCASAKDDPRARERYARYQRMSASPASAAQYLTLLGQLDVRSALPQLTMPTLVLHSSRDQDVPIELARYTADHIDGATLVELDSADHMLWFHEALDLIGNEIQDFVAGAAPAHEVSRVVVTLLFADLITAMASASDERDERLPRMRQEDDHARRVIDRFRGRAIKHDEDGLLVTFDSPARGVRCALALVAELQAEGVQLRVGLHAGECDVIGDDIGGPAVQLARGVARLARPGQVVVSQTVRDLVLGSSITFDQPQATEVAGVPDEWRVYAVTCR